MDVDLPCGQVVDGETYLHAEDEGLDEQTGFGSDDVGPEQEAGVRIGENLAEGVFVLEGPAVRGVAVLLPTRDVGRSIGSQVLFRGSN